ncbi:MAG: hypothetical protein EI684_19285 [Candidatus Viridilinea halotolerans]|uniref:Uncharacterized protein n=1 Tax=Candidatus Viridilinea halotolerans TaxID=2491704 RepID=A0A426TST3_9CHLR|nr:MAG: hypothetical protein EI684_19285 [Candidatus Viridilinea halotolerans]
MPLIERITLTYTQRIQLAPYNHVDAGLIVQVAPHPDDGPDAIHNLAHLIATTWEVVAQATHLQIETAVATFDQLLDDRRQRGAAGEASASSGTRNGASFAPAKPEAITAKQREILHGLTTSLGWSEADVAAFATRWGTTMSQITRSEAQALIQELHQQLANRAAAPSASTSNPPKTVEEARKRFFARYGAAIGGDLFAHVRGFLGEPTCPEPRTIKEWTSLAERVRDTISNNRPA